MVSLRQEIDITTIYNSSVLEAINATTHLHHFCGASLINVDPPIIMTAAHCIDAFTYNESESTFMYHEGNYTLKTQLFADLNRTYPDDEVDGDSYQTLAITDPASLIQHPWWIATGNSLMDGADIALIVLDDSQSVDL